MSSVYNLDYLTSYDDKFINQFDNLSAFSVIARPNEGEKHDLLLGASSNVVIRAVDGIRMFINQEDSFKIYTADNIGNTIQELMVISQCNNTITLGGACNFQLNLVGGDVNQTTNIGQITFNTDSNYQVIQTQNEMGVKFTNDVEFDSNISVRDNITCYKNIACSGNIFSSSINLVTNTPNTTATHNLTKVGYSFHINGLNQLELLRSDQMIVDSKIVSKIQRILTFGNTEFGLEKDNVDNFKVLAQFNGIVENYIDGIVSGVTDVKWAAVAGNSNIYYKSGNVGIGTNNPVTRLHVTGNMTMDGTFLPKTTSIHDIGTREKRFRNLFLGGSYIIISNGLINVDNLGNFTFLNIDGNPATITANIPGWKINSSNVYITNSNIGIGLSNPQTALDVNGAVRAIGYCNLLIDSYVSKEKNLAPTASNFSYMYSVLTTTASDLFATNSNVTFLTNCAVFASNSIVVCTDTANVAKQAAARSEIDANVAVQIASVASTAAMTASSNATSANNQANYAAEKADFASLLATIAGDLAVTSSNFLDKVKNESLLAVNNSTSALEIANSAIDSANLSMGTASVAIENANDARTTANEASSLATVVEKNVIVALSNAAFASNNALYASNVAFSATQTGTYASNASFFASNRAVLANDSAYFASNLVGKIIINPDNTSLDIALSAQNTALSASNFAQEIYPIALYASNQAFFANSNATLSMNKLLSTSNEIFPTATYASNSALFASNASCFASNTAVVANDIAYYASNLVGTLILNPNNAALEFAISAVNVAAATSNRIIALSNEIYPIAAYASNQILYVNTGVNIAINRINGTSNEIYPIATYASNKAVNDSNLIFSILSSFGNLSNSNDNIWYFSSNKIVNDSNSIFPELAYLSNVSYNNTILGYFSSNKSVTNSNALFPMSSYASNVAYFGSNKIFDSSNALFPMSSYASNVSYFGSNKIVNTSNALFQVANFASNAAYFASNTGFRVATYASNTAFFASNAAFFSSNHASPWQVSESNYYILSNVGIGTSSPSYSLDVASNVRLNMTNLLSISYPYSTTSTNRRYALLATVTMNGYCKLKGTVGGINAADANDGQCCFDIEVNGRNMTIAGNVANTNAVNAGIAIYADTATPANFCVYITGKNNYRGNIAISQLGDTQINTTLSWSLDLLWAAPVGYTKWFDNATDMPVTTSQTTFSMSSPGNPVTLQSFVNSKMGIGTSNPMFKLHNALGSAFIGDAFYASATIPSIATTTPLSTANGHRLVFDNTYNGVTGAGMSANKIVLHNNNAIYGFGVETSGLAYHSGTGHNFYTETNNASYGSNVFTINSNGNIGIGNAKPTTKLDIKSITSPAISISTATATTIIGMASTVGSYSASAIVNDTVIRSKTNTNLMLQTGTSTAAMIITNNNEINVLTKLGIGISNPSFKLHNAMGSVFIGDITYASDTIPSATNSNSIANGYRLVFDNTYNGVPGSGMPANKIVLYNNSKVSGFGCENNALTYHSVGSHNFYVNTNTLSYGTNAMCIHSNAYVGINTSNPLYNLDINGTTRSTAIYSSKFGQDPATVNSDISVISQCNLNVTSKSNLNFSSEFINVKCNTIQIAKFNSLGLGIGTNALATTAYKLYVAGEAYKSGGSSLWATGSDQRVKKNIIDADLDVCYNTIKSIPLKRFEWDSNLYPNVKDHNLLGWIAQDIEKVFPKSVTKSEGYGFADFKSLDCDQLYKCMYGALNKSISLIETLKDRVDALETTIHQISISNSVHK